MRLRIIQQTTTRIWIWNEVVGMKTDALSSETVTGLPKTTLGYVSSEPNEMGSNYVVCISHIPGWTIATNKPGKNG